MRENRIKKELAAAPPSIIGLVDMLVEEGHDLQASDIHIDPSEKDVKIRMRIDGVLQDIDILPKEIQSEVVTRIKVIAGLRTDEHQAPQDGRFRVILGRGSSIDVRVSIAPTYYGENVVLRLLSERAEKLSLDTLGFSEEAQEKVRRAARSPYGMILATGPTGSGKTTTLYTLLKQLNTREVSVITIEDPIEYSLEGINQIQVNAQAGLTFANGLRSVLRQDPDIIMVGEIRDHETAGLAVNTALTGHLVLSTLHTNDAATTLPRMLDLGLEPYLITATVNLVIGQRLVRKICQECKTEHELTVAEFQRLSEMHDVHASDQEGVFCTGKGCDACNGSGYKGRIGIYEVIEMSDAIREAMLHQRSATDIKRVAMEQGMQSMVEDGFAKVMKGMTTIEEILRVIHA